MSKLNIGQLLITRRKCSLWHRDLDEEVEALCAGDVLLVLQSGDATRPKRLNPDMYARVISPRGGVGWVYVENCDTPST